MDILFYDNLDSTGLHKALERTVAALQAGDFRAADVKKMVPGPYYRAKLSDADRLIFRFGKWQDQTCLIILEVIRNHDYSASRFLRGATVDEARLTPLHNATPLQAEDTMPLTYVNPRQRRVHLLDKIISFDDEQEEALLQHPPLILIGSAGSGKTVLTLEKLRRLPGEVLYLTHSPYLVDNARTIYFSHNYENDAQEVDFLSFQEFIDTIAVPKGRPLTFNDFNIWFRQMRGSLPQAVRDAHKLFEEFNGVLTGSAVNAPYLTREEYLTLGVRRSIFPAELRPAIYDTFQRYLAFLPGSGCYDLNIISHEHHKLCRPTYDFLVADEVQDMTTVQISLALKSLRQPDQFVLCGDSNQIVHPNFFSWAAIKTWLHDKKNATHGELLRLLNTNYRNAPAVTEVANRLLRVKQARFGSIDRESHYLIRPVSNRAGSVTFLADTPANRSEIDRKTSRSTRFAVVVLRDEDKEAARRSFNTPLVFSVREAKGLEYDHIILPGLISSQAAEFREIARGVTADDLQSDFAYGRARDKSDRSLDAFKFYINAFYVALTRAIANVYILESDATHPLLQLLQLQASQKIDLATQQSTEAEWREEAQRLERQGKLDQLEAIRRDVLRMEPVPWQVLDNGNIDEFAATALKRQPHNQKELRLILDYAVCHFKPQLIADLVVNGYKHAIQPEIARQTVLQRYGADYQQNGFRDLWRKITRHGVDFRNQLNQTPLMLAVLLTKDKLVAELIEAGAALDATDNLGRTPLHLCLHLAYQNPLHARRTLPQLYHVLCPPATNVRVGNRLVQVDKHRHAFFLFHSMIARFDSHLFTSNANEGFAAADFMEILNDFPDSVIPHRYRTRSAITAALSGNEVYREAPYNRRLFLRTRRGLYIPNMALELHSNGHWVKLIDLLNAEALADNHHKQSVFRFIRAIHDDAEKYLNTVAAQLPAEKGARKPRKPPAAKPARSATPSAAAPHKAPAARKPPKMTPPANDTSGQKTPPPISPAPPPTAPEPETSGPAPQMPATTAPPPTHSPLAAPADAAAVQPELPIFAAPSTPPPTAAPPLPAAPRKAAAATPPHTAPTPASAGAAATAKPLGPANSNPGQAFRETVTSTAVTELMDIAQPSLALPDHVDLKAIRSHVSHLYRKIKVTADDEPSFAEVQEALADCQPDTPNKVAWVLGRPEKGIPCLMRFLEQLAADKTTPLPRHLHRGCLFAILQLASWYYQPLYPLIFPLMRRIDAREADKLLDNNYYRIIRSVIAACCDGDLTPIKQSFKNTTLPMQTRINMLLALPCLMAVRDLAPAIALPSFKAIITAKIDTKKCSDDQWRLFQMAHLLGITLFPTELGIIIAENHKNGLFKHSSTTMADFANSLRMSADERKRQISAFFGDLPSEAWQKLIAPLGSTEHNDSLRSELFRAAMFGRLQGDKPSPQSSQLNREIDQTQFMAGRNDPCPCGSGRKYKKCCGKNLPG